MTIYIASSKKHAGKIEEDIFIRDTYINKGIDSEITTLEKITKKAKASDVVILKSIWGYHRNYKKFLKQLTILEKNNVKLINDYVFIRWNIEKDKYLDDMKDFNIIPTLSLSTKRFNTYSDLVDKLSNIGTLLNSNKLVIKPTISESGYLTYIYDTTKKNRLVINALKENQSYNFIVQPYRSSISKGELSIIVINGKILYGVRRFPGIFQKKKNTEYLELNAIPTSIKRDISVLRRFFNKKFGTLPKICRIDFLNNNMKYEILEVELIDPDLFFRLIPETILHKSIYKIVNNFLKR
ncbi:MAG: hypothetical protein WDZ80_00470 [Candidatus Paceibacterota bacterium]